jgi:hypothetical protein
MDIPQSKSNAIPFIFANRMPIRVANRLKGVSDLILARSVRNRNPSTIAYWREPELHAGSDDCDVATVTLNIFTGCLQLDQAI